MKLIASLRGLLRTRKRFRYWLIIASFISMLMPSLAWPIANTDSFNQPIADRQSNSIFVLPNRRFAQNAQTIKNKSAVFAEVKSRYKAQVLKISLDQRNNVYRVRILLPNGKVRNISVSAVK